LYRVSFWLVKNHANHLALLVYRLPESEFKCLIAEILNDELGKGDYNKYHLVIWDNFLKSIEVKQIPNQPIYQANNDIFKYMHLMLMNESIDFVIGLEGVGVECICQVYLDIFRKAIVTHPYIIANNIDWEFWDIHTGGVDIAHKKLVRMAVEELIKSERIKPDLVLKGYHKAKDIWRDFWANVPES
jgi:L-rhamnose mutarotase